MEGQLASEKNNNLRQCQSIHHKSHMKSQGLRLRLHNGKPNNTFSWNMDKPKFISWTL